MQWEYEWENVLLFQFSQALMEAFWCNLQKECLLSLIDFVNEMQIHAPVWREKPTHTETDIKAKFPLQTWSP